MSNHGDDTRPVCFEGKPHLLPDGRNQLGRALSQYLISAGLGNEIDIMNVATQPQPIYHRDLRPAVNAVDCCSKSLSTHQTDLRHFLFEAA